MTDSTRVTLITGASRGLGLEVARLLARQGDALIITARGADALASASEELSPLTDVLALDGDVADPAHIEKLVRAGMERFGRIDRLINNASSAGPSPMPAVADYPLAAFETVLRTNVIGPLHLAQLVLPQMLQRDEGTIVNVTSDAGVEAYPGWGGYGASKAALEHLSRVLAAEIEGSGVCIFVFDPGDMNTVTHQLAEPGADLSNLPDAAPSAGALLRLLNHETAAFGRFTAGRLLAASST